MEICEKVMGGYFVTNQSLEIFKPKFFGMLHKLVSGKILQLRTTACLQLTKRNKDLDNFNS